MRSRANIYSIEQCLLLSFINPANKVPGVQIGHAPWIISSHRLTINTTKNALKNSNSQKRRDPELTNLVCSNGFVIPYTNMQVSIYEKL